MSSTSDGPAEAYLPPEIPRARVLITVKTYPQPSRSYTELVCTAGLLDGERWGRIYPVSLSHLQDSGDAGILKYSWVEFDLVRRTKGFRAESYGPKSGIYETIAVGLHLLSVPGMRESILEGMATPVEACSKQIDWWGDPLDPRGPTPSLCGTLSLRCRLTSSRTHRRT